MVDKGGPFYLNFLGEADRVGAKSLILSRYLRVAPQP